MQSFLSILIFAAIVGLVVFGWWYNSPKQKGKRGEQRVHDILSYLPDEYHVLDDVVLKTENGAGGCHRSGMLAIVVGGIAENNLARMEVVDASGIVVAIEAAGCVERVFLMDACANKIEAMQTPIKAQTECLEACQLPFVSFDRVLFCCAFVLVMKQEVENGTISFGSGFDGLHGFLQGIGGEPIVAIKHGNVLSSSMLESFVPCYGSSLILRKMENQETWVFGCIFLQNAERMVGRGIIYANKLYVAQGL